MRRLILKDKCELTNNEIKSVLDLLALIWPHIYDISNIDNLVKENKTESPFHKVMLYYDNNELIGHTEVFSREMIIDSEEVQVLALAAVCVKPNFRGKNIGLELVKKAFGFVDNGTYNLSIFQTSVPDFYLKLNCKQIDNRFLNSKSEINVDMNPWRDPYVMLYPKSYEIGNKVIDLNGECY